MYKNHGAYFVGNMNTISANNSDFSERKCNIVKIKEALKTNFNASRKIIIAFM